jgi:catechol 2,3-dioxygenase-like lactoylglutathione lyase family enzyme
VPKRPPEIVRATECMTSRISHTTIDSRNAYQQSVWLAQVLGMREDPQDPNEPADEECMIFSADGRTRLLFIDVPEGKKAKNRLHFDLRPTDATRDEEVARLLGLGAAEAADHRRPDGSGWVTLSDPEGNEFCVLRSDRDVSDPYAHMIS